MYGETPYGYVPYGALAPSGAPIALAATSSLAVVPTSVYKMMPYLFDTLQLGSSSSGSLHAFNAVVDRLGMQTATLIAWSLFATSSANFADTSAYTVKVVLAAIDTLLATDLVGTKLEAREAVIDAIAAQTLTELKFNVGAVDSIAFTDALTNALQFAEHLVDSILLQSAATPTLHCVLLASSGLAVATTLAGVLHATEAVTDSIGLFLNIRLDTGDFTGWVLNPEGRSVTEYRNYEFNSFTAAFGTYFGAGDGGIYELVGSDDDGTPIDAWIRNALTNFGSDVIKNVPALYVGLVSDGSLVLKVVVSNDPTTGGKREFWYTSPPKAAASSQGTRFEPGKGLEAVYWQWELHNVDGADFGINVVSWYPVYYARRV